MSRVPRRGGELSTDHVLTGATGAVYDCPDRERVREHLAAVWRKEHLRADEDMLIDYLVVLEFEYGA